ncbi:MAG TPA: ATP-binding protein [Candidatus Kapabacteria bacterium]|jgi:PAS domain S-box-containing protein|nr:ATP-binding protein [Candidatus Kapabacteria bacterium]
MPATPQTASVPGRFVARAHRLSWVAGLIALAIGVMVLVGWALDIAILKSPTGTLTMKANAALALALAGISLFGLHGVREPAEPWLRSLLRGAFIGAGGVVGVLGLLTLSEHVFGVDLGIDQMLAYEPAGALATASPGRFGVPASVCFSSFGVALVLAHLRRAIAAIQVIAVGVLLWALLAFMGYLYAAAELYTITRVTAIAAHTAVTLGVLAVGLLAAFADRGLVAAIGSDREGGRLARRAMLAAIVTPIVLGWFFVFMQRQGFYDIGFAVAMLVVAIVIIVSLVIGHGAVRLDREARQRMLAEARLGLNEARLRQLTTLIDLSHDPILVWDLDGGIVEWNTGCERLYGYTREEVIGRPSDLLFGAEGGRNAAMRELLERNLFWSGEVRHTTRGGRTVTVESRQQLMPTEGRRLVLESNRDVTERRRLEIELAELLRREQLARIAAEESARLKDEFLATVSHELRTPLNAILGWVTLLRTEEIDAQTGSTALETIERNARIQAELVNDILDVSRIVAGKLQLARAPLRLASVVEAAIDTVRPAATAKHLDVSVTVDEPDLIVAGDADRLQQIVWNLMSNAVKFTPAGGSIRIVQERAGSNVRLTVADSGCGITPEFLPFVFERFLQADGSRTRRHGGLGLGLAIARHLAELHGGTIVAASDGTDRGSTFTLELPLEAGLTLDAASDVASKPVDGTRVRGERGLEGVRVLVVDDEADARAMLRGILEHHGAVVTVADGAREAMRHVQAWRPQVLLCDIGMPEEDGYSLIGRVRGMGADGAGVPAIALTGYARAGERERAIDAGFHRFLAKPIEADTLVAMINDVLEPEATR